MVESNLIPMPNLFCSIPEVRGLLSTEYLQGCRTCYLSKWPILSPCGCSSESASLYQGEICFNAYFLPSFRHYFCRKHHIILFV